MPLRGATSASHAASSACRWSGETTKYEALVTSDSQSVSNICIGSPCVVMPAAVAFQLHFTATTPDIVTPPRCGPRRELSYSLVSVVDGVRLLRTDGLGPGGENRLSLPRHRNGER